MVLCALPARPLFVRHNGEALSDFDVLSLVDTAAQWYADATEREQLQLENKLRELLRFEGKIYKADACSRPQDQNAL